MKKVFFPRLAVTGIKSSRQLYLPYILTATGMTAMFYIITFLSFSPLLEQMRGGGNLAVVLSLGKGVIGVFSLIFLFYTNSFLIRRRKKEFGLYNILGMNKLNIAKILFFESLYVAILSIIGGLVIGVVFSKTAELTMLKILHIDSDFTLRISSKAIIQTAVCFMVIDILIYLNALRQLHRTDPLELLHSENVGEKPPKANIVFALIGLVILAAAYILAVSIKKPLEAMAWFFVAVIMVIIATYILFIAGSVALCKLLQKNKRYYYKANHFVSVSSMTYRMKRNGAGLASICILSTMVLVMLSSTVSLYIGENDSLRRLYPRDIMANVGLYTESTSKEDIAAFREDLMAVPEKLGIPVENIYDYRSSNVTGVFDGIKLDVDPEKLESFDVTSYDSTVTVYITPLEDYNLMNGTDFTLSDGEALIYCSRITYDKEYIQIADTEPFKITSVLTEFDEDPNAATEILPCIYLVVPNYEECIAPIAALLEEKYNDTLQIRWTYGFDLAGENIGEESYNSIQEGFYETFQDKGHHFLYANCDNIEDERAEFYALYGGLFFIGIMLSIVFVFAAVLIIYYKQVSEGYEDRARFEVMQKVGMTKKEIKKSINSQVLTVFFAPLVMAGLHLGFAFPLIWKCLQLFNLRNLPLLIIVTIASFLIFAVFYAGVYRITSNTYYKIVSDNSDK